jgi:hypothetical protein
VDWECAVLKNYSDVNLGCGIRPATGISWAFEQVEEAVILEDDCIPHPTFFEFCRELFERYREDERVMQINGHNFQFGRKRGSYSYFFSRHNPCCGAWGTWRRAWRYFDMKLELWPMLRESAWLLGITEDRRAAEYWQRMFDQAYAARGDIHYWDYQWTFTCWAQNGLSITPNVNLASNIGFRPDGTHTRSPNNKIANLPMEAVTFPLQHPPYVAPNREADQFFINEVVVPSLPKPPSVYRRARYKLGSVVPAPLKCQIARLRSKLALADGRN